MNIVLKEVREFIKTLVEFKKATEKDKIMRVLVSFIFILCLSSTAFSQEPDIHVSNDIFLNIYYNRGQVIVVDEKLKVVDKVAQGIIEKKIPSKYTFRVEVGTCEYEKANDRYISYKRLEHLFNYLEKKYNIERGKFQFDFSDSEFCYIEQEDNISFINFALQSCKVSSESEINIFGDVLENIFYKKNNVIPSTKGKKLLYRIGTAIKENKNSNKYRICIQISTCEKEKESNSFIAYERIEFLLNYLEKEFEIERERIQFEFINNNQGSKSSFIRFVLLSCE